MGTIIFVGGKKIFVKVKEKRIFEDLEFLCDWNMKCVYSKWWEMKLEFGNWFLLDFIGFGKVFNGFK